jgi:hypothetical protein
MSIRNKFLQKNAIVLWLMQNGRFNRNISPFRKIPEIPF